MAGMPKVVVSRANEILKKLEKQHEFEPAAQHKMKANDEELPSSDMQMSFFQLDDPVLEQIKQDILNTDINQLTPVEALLKLNEIKKLVGN
jgi:DNA mismatch repair protein MutS